MGKIKENSFQKNESRVQFELPYILTRQTTQRTSEQFELIPEIFTQKKNCGKIKKKCNIKIIGESSESNITENCQF